MSVLFLDIAGTVLWVQGRSRVGPGYLQCRGGGKRVRAAASAIANAYAAPIFGGFCKEICVSGVLLCFGFCCCSDSVHVGSKLKRAGGERRAPSSRPLRSNGL